MGADELAKQCLDELMEIMWYRGPLPEEGRAIEILGRYLKVGFSAADIRVFLANNLPCYENEDDFIFLARAEDIERVAIELYRHLLTADRVCGKSK